MMGTHCLHCQSQRRADGSQAQVDTRKHDSLGARRFVVVDYVGLDAVIAREVGKRKLERIPVRVANPDRTPGDRAAWTPDLVSIPEGAWEGAVKRFKSLKPLLEMDRTKRTLEKVQEIADAVGKHPATIYRWLEAYERSERLFV
jgi:putative transposase